MIQTALALSERRCAWCNRWIVQSCKEQFVCGDGKCGREYWTWFLSTYGHDAYPFMGPPGYMLKHERERS